MIGRDMQISPPPLLHTAQTMVTPSRLALHQITHEQGNSVKLFIRELRMAIHLTAHDHARIYYDYKVLLRHLQL